MDPFQASPSDVPVEVRGVEVRPDLIVWRGSGDLVEAFPVGAPADGYTTSTVVAHDVQVGLPCGGVACGGIVSALTWNRPACTGVHGLLDGPCLLSRTAFGPVAKPHGPRCPGCNEIFAQDLQVDLSDVA